MFKLHEIELEGTFSIDKFRFDFEKHKGKILVVGQNKDEFAATSGAIKDATATISNESGKTNFFDGIEEHFTGVTPKGLKNDGVINVFTDTGAMSRAVWSANGHTYRTEKFRKYVGDGGKSRTGITVQQDAINLTDNIAAQDLTKRRSKDNKLTIQQFFPYSLEEFRSLVYIPASETYPLLLPDGKAKDKRQLINTIYRLQYEELLKAARDRKSTVEKAIDQLKARMSGEIESLEEQLAAVGDVDQLRARLAEIPESQVAELREQIQTLEKRVQEITASQEAVQSMLDRKRELDIDDPRTEAKCHALTIESDTKCIAQLKDESALLAVLQKKLEERERYLAAIQGYVVREDELYEYLGISKEDPVESLLKTTRATLEANIVLIPRHVERDMLLAQRAEIQTDELTGDLATLQRRMTALEADLATEQLCIHIYSEQKAFVLAHGMNFESDFDEQASQQIIDEKADDLSKLKVKLETERLHLTRAEEGDCPNCGRPYDDVTDVTEIQALIDDLETQVQDVESEYKEYRNLHQRRRDAMRAYQALPADDNGNIYQLLDTDGASVLTTYETQLAALHGANQKRQRIYNNLKYVLEQTQALEKNTQELAAYTDLDDRKSTQLQAENQRLRKTIELAEELHRILTDHHRDYAEWHRLQNETDNTSQTAAQVQAKITHLAREIETAQTAQDTRKARLHQVNAFMDQFADYLDIDLQDIPLDEAQVAMDELEVLRERRDALISERTQINATLEHVSRLQASIAESRAKQDEIDVLRRKQQVWHTLTHVFSSGGLPKDKIQEIIHQINERIKVYAPIIFHRPRQIYFEVSDKGDILLRQTKRGHIMKSVSNSSGGRIKVTAAVLFALRDTLPPNKKSSILTLDEFDLNLDEISALRILDALDVHIQRSNVETVLMTSHKTLLRRYKSQSGNAYWDHVLLATMQNEITTYSLHAAA